MDMGVCYSIQYKGMRVTAKVYRKHRFVLLVLTVKPTLININILHPKVSAAPLLRPPLVRVCVSAQHTKSFYISFAADSSLCLSWMCVCVWSVSFRLPSTSKVQLRSTRVLQRFLFFLLFLLFCVLLYHLPIEKETKKFTRVRIVPFSRNPFFFSPRVHRLSGFTGSPWRDTWRTPWRRAVGKTGLGEGGGGVREKPLQLANSVVLSVFTIQTTLQF